MFSAEAAMRTDLTCSLNAPLLEESGEMYQILVENGIIWLYGATLVTACVFCRSCYEDRFNLLFECPITRRICGNVLDASYKWDNLVVWGLGNLKGKSLRVLLCKLAWWSSVYHLWLQRNAVVHASTVRSEEQLLKNIRKDVKVRLERKGKFHKKALDNSAINGD